MLTLGWNLLWTWGEGVPVNQITCKNLSFPVSLERPVQHLHAEKVTHVPVGPVLPAILLSFCHVSNCEMRGPWKLCYIPKLHFHVNCFWWLCSIISRMWDNYCTRHWKAEVSRKGNKLKTDSTYMYHQCISFVCHLLLCPLGPILL